PVRSRAIRDSPAALWPAPAFPPPALEFLAKRPIITPSGMEAADVNPLLDQNEMTALFAQQNSSAVPAPSRLIPPPTLDALQRGCESLAASIGPKLAQDINCKLDAQALPAIQLPYHECLLTLSRPTIICVAATQPSGAQICIELSPSLAYFLIERLLGSD